MTYKYKCGPIYNTAFNRSSLDVSMEQSIPFGNLETELITIGEYLFFYMFIGLLK